MDLRVHGFKGLPVQAHLGARTLLLGPNGSGKSTVLFALRYAIAGHDPALGKKLEATAALLHGKEGVVDVTFDDGTTIHRALTDTGRGLTAHVACSWVTDPTGEPHALAALRLVADDEEDVVEVLDIRTLFALSANKRAARLERLLLSTAQSVDAKVAAAARYVTQRLTETPDERMPAASEVAAFRGLQAQIPKAQAALIRELWPQFKATCAAQGLPGAITWANEGKKATARQTTQATQAQRALEARVKMLPAVPDGAIAALDAKRDSLVAAQGAAEATAKQTRELQVRVELADRAVATAQAEVDRLVPAVQAALASAERAQLREQLRVAEARVHELAGAEPILDLREADELDAAARELDQQVAAAVAALVPVPPEPSDADLRAAERQLASLRDSVWSEVRAIAIATVTAVAKVKGAAGTTVRDQMTRLDALAEAELGADPAALGIQISELRAAYEAQKHARLDALDARAKAEGAIATLRERAGALRREALQCREALLAPVRADQAAREAAVADASRLRTAYDALVAEADQVVAALRDAERALESAQAARQALGDAPVAVDTQDLAGDLQKVTSELRELRQAEAARRELAEVTAELTRLAQLGKVFPAIHWAAERVRNEEIEDTGGPLRARLQQFFDAAGLAHVRPFVRAGRDTCELGWFTGGAEVPVQALGGGEWVLFATAFVAAILALRPAKPFRPLLVEGAELDDGNLLNLLAGIAAVGDAVTHAVVATCHAPELVPGDWDVLEFPQAPRLMAAAEGA